MIDLDLFSIKIGGPPEYGRSMLMRLEQKIGRVDNDLAQLIADWVYGLDVTLDDNTKSVVLEVFEYLQLRELLREHPPANHELMELVQPIGSPIDDAAVAADTPVTDTPVDTPDTSPVDPTTTGTDTVPPDSAADSSLASMG